MSKENETNNEDKMLTDVIYFKEIHHGNIIEFRPTIFDHLGTDELKVKYFQNKNFFDALQHIYIFLYVELKGELFDYLLKASNKNGALTLTYNYTKLIEDNDDLKDKLIEFFNDIFAVDSSKYNRAIELFCSGKLNQNDTLYNQIKQEDNANE